jgi:protoporphyrinogen/coproporphyrinogen III oxidase
MTRDVVIIGGGIAGLSAAWRLRHRDVLLLEAGDRLGGRMRSDPCGAYWLNHGAHLFPGPGSIVDGMARHCGLETVPVMGGMMGLAVVRTGLKVQRAVARYHRPGRGPDFEDDRTFAELLGPLPPAVHGIFSCAAHRATAELDELSAACGLGLFALVWGGKGSLIARNLLGGTGALPAALGRELGERARTGAHVDAIRPEGAELAIEVGGEEIRARQVIVAAQAPHAAPLVAPVAERAADALAQLTYGAFLTVAVQTSETGSMPYDDVYAVATPGRAFDMFVNPAHVLRGAGPRLPGGSLMLFAGARHAAALMAEPDDVVVVRFLADLHALYPQTRGAIAGATVHRWELGNVYARPGRARLGPALAGALGPHENLHLVGDWAAELGNMEAAARTGVAAAERVDARIREVTHV